MKNLKILFLSLFGYFGAVGVASAHEAYVLPYNTFWDGMKQPFSLQAFDSLKSPQNVHITLVIMAWTFFFLGLNFLFRRSDIGKRAHAFIERYAHLGQHFIRVALAVVFIFSALSNDFLGPELHGGLFPYPHLIQIALFTIGLMIAAGFLTELAAAIGLFIFIYS